jgi:hypothetical protein
MPVVGLVLCLFQEMAWLSLLLARLSGGERLSYQQV